MIERKKEDKTKREGEKERCKHRYIDRHRQREPKTDRKPERQTQFIQKERERESNTQTDNCQCRQKLTENN